MSEANPWYKICDKRALEGRKNDLFRPSRALLPFPKSRGSQKALAPGYCLAPLRGFGKLPETAKTSKRCFFAVFEVFVVRFWGLAKQLRFLNNANTRDSEFPRLALWMSMTLSPGSELGPYEILIGIPQSFFFF
jgi:hypothetical protein